MRRLKKWQFEGEIRTMRKSLTGGFRGMGSESVCTGPGRRVFGPFGKEEASNSGECWPTWWRMEVQSVPEYLLELPVMRIRIAIT